MAIGRSIVATWPLTPSPKICTSPGRSANGRAHDIEARMAAATLSRVTGISRRARVPIGGRGVSSVAASIISAIGVMPAIGSLENAPSEYDTAPTSLPSMYTGLPLMPAMTPVWASGPPSSLARIRSRRGPMTLRSTPMMWTLNSSILSPCQTV